MTVNISSDYTGHVCSVEAATLSNFLGSISESDSAYCDTLPLCGLSVCMYVVYYTSPPC